MDIVRASGAFDLATRGNPDRGLNRSNHTGKPPTLQQDGPRVPHQCYAPGPECPPTSKITRGLLSGRVAAIHRRRLPRYPPAGTPSGRPSQSRPETGLEKITIKSLAPSFNNRSITSPSEELQHFPIVNNGNKTDHVTAEFQGIPTLTSKYSSPSGVCKASIPSLLFANTRFCHACGQAHPQSSPAVVLPAWKGISGVDDLAMTAGKAPSTAHLFIPQTRNASTIISVPVLSPVSSDSQSPSSAQDGVSFTSILQHQPNRMETQ